MNAGCGQASVETIAAIVDAFKRPDVGAIMGYRADDAARLRARGPHPWGRKSEGAAAVGEALAARFPTPVGRTAGTGWRAMSACRNGP